MYKFVKPGHEAGVFFKTEHALVIDDILGKVAEIVHRHGLELFAWMTTRYATYGAEKRVDYQSLSYNFETKKMEVGRGFNLFHPDVLLRLEGLFRDLGRYPIDGILFQDDLIFRHNEDFSLEANKAFLKVFGYSPTPDIFYVNPFKSESGKYYVKGYTEQFWTWAKWKNHYLMDVAMRLVAAAKESNPKLQFALPLLFKIGAAIDMVELTEGEKGESSVLLTVDAEHPRDYQEQLRFGTEFIYQSLLALRMGYVTGLEEEGISLGFGLMTTLGEAPFGLDYAYTPVGPLGDVHRLTFNFTMPR